MEKKTFNRYFNLFALGIGLASFGLGASVYSQYSELIEKYSLDSITTIVGFLLLIYSLLHYGPRISEIVKKLR